ncbi:Toll/interleukin-1 receptor domain-containing protein, partial [Tanacetum coccineum]
MTGPNTQPKQPIDKAYSIASIKACIPTPLDLDKLNYNSWSALFQRFCRTYEVHQHLEVPSTTATSAVDLLHETNDSLVVMWMYLTISSKLVEMVLDVDTVHGVWKRLKDLFHNNKDARVTQLDNEIRNMTIGSSSVTNFFQDIKSKADRLANLDSPVKDTSLVTYAVNGIRSKYPDAARVIRLREKAPTFDELRSMMLLEESDMSHQSVSSSLLHTSSSSPTVLVASTIPHDKANTMSTSGFDVCPNFQRDSCSYGSRYKFVHGANDLRPRPFTTSSTAQGRVQSNSMNRTSQVVPNITSKPNVPNNTTRNSGQSVAYHQPILSLCKSISHKYSPATSTAQPQAFGPTGPFQPAQLGSFISAQQGPPGSTPYTAAPQFQQIG